MLLACYRDESFIGKFLWTIIAFWANIKGTVLEAKANGVRAEQFVYVGRDGRRRRRRGGRGGTREGRGREGRRGAHNKLGSMGEIKRKPSPSMQQEESGARMRGILRVTHFHV